MSQSQNSKLLLLERVLKLNLILQLGPDLLI